MTSLTRRLRTWLCNPRQLLLVDAAGAGTTAFVTYFLLAAERWKTGLPPGILSCLAMAALCFALLDILFFFQIVKPSVGLRVISCLNLGYCGVVFLLLVANQKETTLLGLAHFSFEAALVIPLAIWEWRVARSGLCEKHLPHAMPGAGRDPSR